MKTLKELRIIASEMGIKNYTKYSKVELQALLNVNEEAPIVVEIDAEEELTKEEAEIIAEEEKVYEATPNLPSLIYSNNLIEVPAPKKEKKGRRVSFEIPDYGTQSRRIYDYIQDHLFDKNFTVYRVCQILNTPSNNTRRIYLKFFAQKRDEFLLSNKLEEMENRVIEPLIVSK